MTTQAPAPVWQTMVYDGLFAVTVYSESAPDAPKGRGSLQVWHSGTGALLHNEPVPVKNAAPEPSDIWLWRGHALRFIDKHLNGGDASEV